MLGRARIRLALCMTALSWLLVLCLGLYALYLTKTQYITSRETAFLTAGSNVSEKLKSDLQVTTEWLASVETQNNLALYVYSTNQSVSQSSSIIPSNKRAEILAAAQEALTALQYDFAAPPKLGHIKSIEFEAVINGEEYRGYAYSSAQVTPWFSFLIMQNKTSDSLYIANLEKQYLFLGAAALAGLLVVSILFAYISLLPVQAAAKKQAAFIASASHELKSPLAVMRASAAAISDSPESSIKMAANIESECARLGALCEDLLTLTSADAGTWRVNLTPQEPDTLILNICQRLEPLCRKSGHTLITKICPELLPKIKADTVRIDQIITILVHNAVSYTPPCNITVSVKHKGKHLEVSVSDQGAGISDKDKKLIFQRFYRIDKSRTDKSHFGLGLPVARELAGLHRGSLKVTDAEEKGACFVLTIPFI